jgi:hypothetical protein
VIVNQLVRRVLEHRATCSRCADAGSALFCRSVDTAIEAMLEWKRARDLCSKAEWLRRRQLERNLVLTKSGSGARG